MPLQFSSRTPCFIIQSRWHIWFVILSFCILRLTILSLLLKELKLRFQKNLMPRLWLKSCISTFKNYSNDFLLVDDGMERNHIIIFGTMKFLQKMAKYEKLWGDGMGFLGRSRGHDESERITDVSHYSLPYNMMLHLVSFPPSRGLSSYKIKSDLIFN